MKQVKIIRPSMQVYKTHLHDLGKPHSLGYLCLDLTVYTMLNEVCGRKGSTEVFGGVKGL